MWPTPDALRDALAAPELVSSWRWDVLDESGTIIAPLEPADDRPYGVTGGSVSCSADSIRWTSTLTVVGDGLVPLQAGDLLHPLSYHRVRPWWRCRLADGTWAEVPMAPMYVDSLPSLVDSGSTSAVTATLALSDAVALIKLSGWREALRLGGQTHTSAIRSILAATAPWLPVNVTPTTGTLPSEYEVGEPGGDPWADIETICQAGDVLAYIDRDGVCQVGPRPPAESPRWAFIEGDRDSLMIDLRVDVDLGDLENVIAVQSDSEDVDPPVVGWWSDDDADSPLWVGRGHILHRGIRSNPAVKTVAQAQQVAAQIGATMRAATQSVLIGSVPVPVLDPWDVIDVARARVGIGGAMQVRSWTLDYEPTDLMGITASGRVTL